MLTADLRVLVMCLYHLTGDPAWLADPYRPARDVRLIADPSAGFAPEVQAEIRAAVKDQMRPDGSFAEPAIGDPGPERFHEMLSVFLGETVPDEYVPMLREDMGFDPGDTEWPAEVDADAAGRLDVLIIGAGASGIALASKLARLGIAYTVVERQDGVGGTWHANRYPGVGVDTPNHFYCYSFAPNTAWSRYFSPGAELRDYLDRYATEAGLREHLVLGTEAVAASWDEAQRRWKVTCRTADGPTHTRSAAVLVAATGHFSHPVSARFDGLDTFTGPVFHSARWPDGVSLKGKRVAVVGTGASAMQIVPTIADDVSELHIFQRTPQWVRPVPEYRMAVEPVARTLFERVPFYGQWYRFGQMWRYGDGLLRFLRRDPDWPHPERAVNRINDRHRTEMVDHITASLAARPELIEHCVPDYPPFGKRILIDNGWYATLCRPHVTLVTDPIDHVTGQTIVTADGTPHEVDAIVLATGFDVTTLAAAIDIRGRGGVALADDWADGDPTALYGMTVPGFPNLFVMYGPNTNMGHGGSGIWLAETQARYITDRLVDMVAGGIAAIDCRPERRAEYTAEVDALHAELIWAHPGVPTYYRNRHGQVRSPMPFRLVDYWHRTRSATLDDFDLTRPR